MHFTKTTDDAADLAVRIIDLLQGILDLLDGIFDQPDQQGRGIRLQQFGQGIRDLVDIRGIGANLAPVDEAAYPDGIVDGAPEGPIGIVATAVHPLGLEQERLEEPVIPLGNIEQDLDQGSSGLGFQILPDVFPGIAGFGLGRFSAGAIGRQ